MYLPTIIEREKSHSVPLLNNKDFSVKSAQSCIYQLLLSGKNLTVYRCWRWRRCRSSNSGAIASSASSASSMTAYNGCAVISPLVVATHIATSDEEYGIPNSAINDIIDKHAAPPIIENG
jgi:hypothetical protein